MSIDDPILPAAAYLTGPHAGDVLRPAVERADGRLVSHRCTHVQYRPGSDLVAQFRVTVSWSGGPPVTDTMFAASTISGAPAGSVPIVALQGDTNLEVGVWRWPFDPVLAFLDTAVRADAMQRTLRRAGVDVAGPVSLRVVVHRPMDRAVIRVTATDRTFYLKIVRPDRVEPLRHRHVVLRDAHLPVPDVLAADADAGWLALAEVPGTTLRDRIKEDVRPWIRPTAVLELIERFADVDPSGLPAVRSRLLDAPMHAALLASVVPELGPALRRLSDMAVTASTERTESTIVHGDLHEAQLIVDDDGSVAGLLDVDGLGVGDGQDDQAVPIGHLRYRAATAIRHSKEIDRLADDLRSVFTGGGDPAELDRTTAGVLVGLATVPFRWQRDGWPAAVRRVVELAESVTRP